MASRRTQLIAVSVALVAVAGGYGLYLATAQSTAPQLAQAPMNITNVIPPAFIMAVDNSGSMSTDETLFRTSDGVGHFSSNSFFDSNGVPRDTGGTAVSKHMDQSGTYQDMYGALRSPEHNRAYYNPATVYKPWQTSSGTPEANASTTAAVEDVRGSGFGAATPLTTFNFTTYLTATETWPNGKVVPAGTQVYNDETCDRAPGATKTANAWVTYAQEKTLTSDCSIQFRYYPARVYLGLNSAPPPGWNTAAGSDKRVLVRGVGPGGADMYRYDIIASNFSSGGATAVQNFANWWTYYGNRNRAMIAAMTQSVSDFNKMRIGYFQINTPPTAQGDANDPNVVMRDMAVQADKDALYVSMRGLNASGNTPTRRATARLVRQFMRSDAGAPIKLQCQKNAGMLFTDGYTNESPAGAATSYWSVGNVDGSYPAPYGGGTASTDTIADYAMYGYITNLRSDLTAGKVPVPKECGTSPVANGLDCNANLHMNFYGITLGARGAVYDVNAAATADPYANPPSWGATGTTNLNPSNVDDIWHAALNSRGEFINATSPDKVTEAMRKILAGLNEGASPSGTIGVTGARIGTGSVTVQPQYESTNNGTDWYGKLVAETVTANAITGEATFTRAWEASEELASLGAANRNIKFGTTGSSVVPTVRDFTAANLSLDALCDTADPLKTAACTPAGITALASGSMTLDRLVAYLRGSKTDEGVLRTRTTILGDIVNSTPLLVAPTDDFGYRSLGGTLATSYGTYLTAKKTANKPLVLFGANDGMLHVLNGQADTSDGGGEELFAYVPATSVGHMGNLAFPYVAADKNLQKFDHRYFVDGPVTVSDVRIGNAWKTVAIGTSGAGGRSVFALDITNPSSISVLWEINNRITNATAVTDKIGYVLGKPVIVPVSDAAGNVSWKAIFGNGYNSTSQQANLFVVDVATGSVSTITASETTAPAYNGLGNVVVIDTKRRNIDNSAWIQGRDGYADTVYAADQNGAVWKFDLLNSSVALGGAPLFIAKIGDVRQPITGGLTAASGPAGGVMVYFGTGSFSFTGDPLDTSTQTLYGILDKGVAVTGRAVLLQQTVGVTSGSFRATSANPMVAGNQGWYMDLPAGERFVGYPHVESGVAFFPTFEPQASTANQDCGVSGRNWLYGLNSLTGGAALTNVHLGTPNGASPTSTTGALALNTGGSAPVKDVAIMTTPRVSPLGAGATQQQIDDAVGAQCSMVIRVAGAPPMYLPRPCGRQSWRQVR
ncbi:MAG: pilus assembly protein [Pseudoxanthomonas sp.]|nr:pilus assembly protein [Pseudoxanthomonas sp.]